MVYLNGGPSHLDTYDPKPDAPVEFRGEFKPIKTNVNGMQISEHLPLHATIADRFAIVRNMKFTQEGHTPRVCTPASCAATGRRRLRHQQAALRREGA